MAQFRLPKMIWMLPSTCGDTRAISGTSRRIASASSTVSVFMPRVPLRTPLTLREPASIQTKFSPRSASACWARCEPAWPIATTRTTAAMPMQMPSVVSALRILWRASARTASRKNRFASMAAAGGWLRGAWAGSWRLADKRSIRRAVYAAPGTAGLRGGAGRRVRAKTRERFGA